MDGKTQHETDLAGTDGGMHARLAQSLRESAHYFESHPDLPIPRRVQIHYCIPAHTDKAGEDEAYRIAGILGAKVTGDTHTTAALSFGPVSYEATYIASEWMAAYLAHSATFQPEAEVAAA